MNITQELNLNPKGFITVSQGNEEISTHNFFTDYGLRQVYKPGKLIVLDRTTGGIFRHLHVGNGSIILTPESTGLDNPIQSASRISSSLSYTTDPITSIRYAEFTTLWRIPAGLDSFSELCMSDNSDGTQGMLCGKSLTGSIILDDALPVDITYMVQIPILSQIGTLDSGTITIAGTNHRYTLEGTFHTESSERLSSILPYEVDYAITGNLSRMYVNNNLLGDRLSYYSCSVDTQVQRLEYNMRSSIVNYDDVITIVNANIGNSDPDSTAVANFPIRIVFQDPVTKPLGLDMEFNFNLILNLIN